MIHYLVGDALQPQAKGLKLIPHVCNDLGKMGSGFALAASKKWPPVRDFYLRWYAGKLVESLGDSLHYHETGWGAFCWQGKFALGGVQFVHVQRDVIVCNMIAQHGVKGGSEGPPIRYGALEQCLAQVARHKYDAEGVAAVGGRWSAHMPRIGCGLAGGRWEQVEPIVQRTLIAAGVDVTVYDLGDSL